MRFAYCHDRLFLIGCSLYAVNRLVIKPLVSPGFFHSYFNDLFLMPCALPLMLWLYRRLRLRDHDRPPAAGEIALHLVIWSLLFEVAGPRWVGHVTADPLDIAAYAAGALIAWSWWNRARLPFFRIR